MLISRLWVAVPALFVATVTQAWASDNPDPNQAIRETLQGELEDFSQPDWHRGADEAPATPGSPFIPDAGPALSAYRDRLIRVADWHTGPVWHQAGTLPLVRDGHPTELLGVNVFFPTAPPQGTLLLLHGYMSHAANFAYTAAFFTARGWTVTTLDLPGHGLSTGSRADVDSFTEYGDAVTVWLKWVEAQGWSGPRVLLAHSLGTAAAFEALRRPDAPHLNQVIFCAPLLRPAWFPLLSVTDVTIRWWMKDFPSTFGWDGYLDGYVMPVHWFEALEDWLNTLDAQPPVDLPLTLFSGDKDTVVDFEWNRQTYQRLVPGAQFVLLPGKDHLFLSNEEDREAFHETLWEMIQAQGAP